MWEAPNMPTFGFLGLLRSSRSARYVIAILVIAASLAAARPLATGLDTPVVSLSLCAIMFVAWFGGLGPALLAGALSILAIDYWFIPPGNTFFIYASGIPRVALFALAAGFVILLSAMQRNTTESLRRARDDLRASVRDLQEVNQALHAESARRQQAEQNLQAIIDTIPALVASYTPEGECDFANRTWQDYTGLSTAEVGMDLLKAVVSHDDTGVGKDESQDWLANPEAFQAERRMRRADGVHRWHLLRRVPFRNSEGKIAKWYIVAVDIEEQKRARDALRRNEAYLAEAQSLSRTGSFAWEIASGEITWSDETYRIFDIDRAVKPNLDLILECVHPDDRQLIQSQLDRSAQGALDYDCEFRLLTRNGQTRFLHIRARRMKFEADEVVGAVMDLTEARQAQQALNEMQTELAHMTRMTTLGELTASIAHEVNQPLAAIAMRGQAGLRFLNRTSPEIDEVRVTLESIIRNATRASDVISHIRSLSRKAASEFTRLDINDVINDTVALVQHQASNHRVRLQLELASGLPDVLGDRVQLQQVIINLVMNGIDAMTEITGRGREMVIRSGRHNGEHVLIAVQDAGVGIDPDSVSRIFDAFYTTKAEGMGMGLSICRSIIEAHSGRMWASRNAGPGATIQFTLPQCLAA
jgi:PAS domain S-box-containing protein